MPATCYNFQGTMSEVKQKRKKDNNNSNNNSGNSPTQHKQQKKSLMNKDSYQNTERYSKKATISCEMIERFFACSCKFLSVEKSNILKKISSIFSVDLLNFR